METDSRELPGSCSVTFSQMAVFPNSNQSCVFLKIYDAGSVLPACIFAGQKRAPKLITDGCEHMWLLGIGLGTFGRAGKALNP